MMQVRNTTLQYKELLYCSILLEAVMFHIYCLGIQTKVLTAWTLVSDHVESSLKHVARSTADCCKRQLK